MSEDALDPLVTQCPNCDTRFRVSEAQLQVAGGRVRCGACLTVFDGAEYLMLDDELLDPAVDASAVDDVLAEIDQFDEGDHDAGHLTVGVASVTPRDAEHDEEFRPEDVVDLSVLEQLEEDLLSELHAPQVDVPTTPDASATNAEAAEALSVPEALSEPEAPRASEDGNAYGADEASALDEAPVEAGPEREDPPPDAADAGAPPADVDGPRADEDEDADAEAGSAEADSDRADPERTDEQEKEDAWFVEVANELWGEEGPPPEVVAADPPVPEVAVPEVELDDDADALEEAAEAAYVAEAHDLMAGDEEAPPGRTWVTYGLIALAAIALPAQVLWFQYEAWVADPAYRPIYERICAVAGCEVPALVDVSQIEAQRSVGRVLPDSEARTIDILMVNKASFAQPFPLIEVVFEDLQGQRVAMSRVSPGQYLPESQPPDAQMQPRTPVHVSFEVPDPGPDATGFSIRFTE